MNRHDEGSLPATQQASDARASEGPLASMPHLDALGDHVVTVHAPTLEQVLTRREARQQLQQQLIAERFMPVVSFTVVAPGPVKNSPLIQRVFAEGVTEIMALLGAEEWVAWQREDIDEPTGPELLLCVDAEPGALKRAMVMLEDGHPWGRLWDIDVIDEDHGTITRTMLEQPVRRCLICDAPSPECARARRHSVDELTTAITTMVRAELTRRCDDTAWLDAPTAASLDDADNTATTEFGRRAVAALLAEARLTPKPGLVDADNNGAHEDMDLAMFERSARVLGSYFDQIALAAVVPDPMPRLRRIGLDAEQAMLAATGGVNTHKGAIFSLGLLVAAEARVGSNVEAICTEVMHLVDKDFRAWLEASKGDSHGEQAFTKTGATGARGEAASGFAIVYNHALPAYWQRHARYHDADDALRWALVAIMSRTIDTNLIARGGADALATVRTWAASLLIATVTPDELIDELRRANDSFSSRRWSPGGSADLVAVVHYLLAASSRTRAG